MARPTKYDAAKANEICKSLEAGCTRRAACISNGVSQDSLARWMKSFADFADAVAMAEAKSEVRNTAIIAKAANGFKATREVRTVKTIFKPRKMHFPKGGTVETTHLDGTVTSTSYPVGCLIEESVALQEVSEQSSVTSEFDWHAALELLKRRSRLDWGDKADLGLKDLTNEQLLEIVKRLADTQPAEAAGGGSGAPGAELAGAVP